MAIRINEDGFAEVVDDPKKRGRKRIPRPQEKALLEVAWLPPVIPEERILPRLETGLDVVKDMISSISQIMRSGQGQDENIFRLLESKGYNPAIILKDTAAYGPILHGLQDELLKRAQRMAEEMGEFSGLGSLGASTLKNAHWGKMVKKQD